MADYGAGMQQVQKDKQKYINDALAHGMTQAQIDAFAGAGGSDVGDYHRLKDLEAYKKGTAKTATPTRPAGPAMTTGGNMAPAAPATPASVVGLDKAAAAPAAEAPPSLPMFVPQEPAGPGIQGTQSGMLRQGMGMRQPPVPNMALAALKRIY